MSLFEHPIPKKINFTRKAKKFYPQGIQLTWLKNGNISQIDKTLTHTKRRDGLYTVQSSILVDSQPYRGHYAHPPGRARWAAGSHFKNDIFGFCSSGQV